MPICLSNCITFNYFDLNTNISKALDLNNSNNTVRITKLYRPRVSKTLVLVKSKI